ncbi:hypothetical protein BCR43DRAFT_195786 [Syncephalastrum racemosum]|uniref:Uncharacterized protein n=1 Tax=Syncephalastrum racemosum TaxID=13706 RepID=A0A1X2HHB7_SYNRA|nr:hypothetical protein BCR43DRAFT_195786 [Syncephalastrum racemosum]
MSKGYYGSSDVSTSYDHRGIRGRASGRGGRGGASRGSANGYHSPRMTSQEAPPQSHSVPSAPLYPSHFQSHSSPHARAESGEKEKVSSPPSLVPLPRRHGQAVPVVQIVAWDDAEPTFVDYIEDAFRSLSVRVHALNLKHGQVSQDEIVKHLVKEGVMALVTVLPGMEIEQHVTLQVFQPDEQAGPGSFHFDEYEKIQVEDCTAVVEQLCETQKVLQDKMNVDQPPSTASNPDQPAYRSSPASLASSLRDLTTGDQPTPTISPHTAPLSAPMLASAFQAPVFSPVTAAQAPTAPSVSLPVNPPTSTTPAAPQPAISSALPAVLSAVQGLDLYSLDQNTLSSLIAAAQGLVNSQSQAAATPPVTNTQSLPAAAGPLPTSVIAQQPTLEAQPYVQQVSQVPLEQRQPFIQPAEQQQPQQLQQQQQHQQLPPQISPDPTALLSNPMIQQLLASMNRSSVSANGAPAAHETPAVHSGQAAVPQYNPQAPGLFPTATQTAISTNSAPTFDAQASVPQSR